MIYFLLHRMLAAEHHEFSCSSMTKVAQVNIVTWSYRGAHIWNDLRRAIVTFQVSVLMKRATQHISWQQ